MYFSTYYVWGKRNFIPRHFKSYLINVAPEIPLGAKTLPSKPYPDDNPGNCLLTANQLKQATLLPGKQVCSILARMEVNYLYCSVDSGGMAVVEYPLNISCHALLNDEISRQKRAFSKC